MDIEDDWKMETSESGESEDRQEKLIVFTWTGKIHLRLANFILIHVVMELANILNNRITYLWPLTLAHHVAHLLD